MLNPCAEGNAFQRNRLDDPPHSCSNQYLALAWGQCFLRSPLLNREGLCSAVLVAPGLSSVGSSSFSFPLSEHPPILLSSPQFKNSHHPTLSLSTPLCFCHLRCPDLYHKLCFNSRLSDTLSNPTPILILSIFIHLPFNILILQTPQPSDYLNSSLSMIFSPSLCSHPLPWLDSRLLPLPVTAIHPYFQILASHFLATIFSSSCSLPLIPQQPSTALEPTLQ